MNANACRAHRQCLPGHQLQTFPLIPCFTSGLQPKIIVHKLSGFHRKPCSLVSSAIATPERTSSSTQGQSNQRSASTALFNPAEPGVENKTVFTKFFWPTFLGGKEIFLWGTFNNWTKGVKLHRLNAEQDAGVVLPLLPGNYEFKFVVDGTWTVAPHEPTATREGTQNNFRVVAPTVTFSLKAPQAQKALVVGDWDNWQYALLLTKDPATGVFSVSAHLPAGQYHYHYVVDDRIYTDPAQPTIQHTEQGPVHRTWSYEPSIFRIFYCTGWDETVLHYRRVRGGKPVAQDWQTQTMVNAPSRGNALGVWKMATLVPGAPGESLEFIMSNGLTGADRKEDRPAPGQGPVYNCPFPGSFKLVKGMLRPFPRGGEARILLVSDIDGTMIGDCGTPAAYVSSARFAEYWENSASLAGSLLAYNTGRSLGQFVELLKRCGGSLAVPDVVITAVGTKVWHLDSEYGRTIATGLKWVEDEAWSRSLDEGWNLDRVRSLARDLVNSYHDPGQLTMLDDGSEHKHRIALSCDARNVEHVTSTMAKGCRKHGLEVRLIVSGAGSHRYVDCVPFSAGKEKALQYVRKQFNIPEHLCVAAGDSGNDILMLEGEHPSIVVGNAQPELVSWLVQQPQDGKVVYAESWYADGVLEGLARHCLY